MTHPENGNKAGDATQKQPNRLIHESSPYLQQHAWNPVDWYPWGNEALDRARQENRLIFLSIGYSSCHWCHVMERECFEDPAIARLLNKHFVNIKVDREERPDVDAVYMEALQMMTGHGGWPLNVWLTPDQIPIYAGTYFPPEDLHGRPGLPTVVSRLAEVYRQQPDKVRKQAEEMQKALDKDLYDQLSHENINSGLLDHAFRVYSDACDRKNGGFSTAPKFPMAMGIGFLLRYSAFPGSDQAQDMALTSLEKMITGGIYDQIGGGFHRYSTDDQWLVPHFEKMLYDNALLLPVLAEAARISPNPVFSDTVKETLDFLNREMRHPDGAYYSALDADTEGVEGKFYTFTYEELKQVLDKSSFSLFARRYGVTPEGNWEGVSILHRATDPEKPAKEDNIDIETVRNRLEKAKKDLLDYRNRRTRPGLDDKIITSWNALMLIGLCRCSQILGQGTEEAIRLGTFLHERMINNDTVYRIVDRDDNVKQPGFLDDYALLIDGFSRLFEITGQAHWLSLSARLTGILIDRFYDTDKNAFHYSSRNERPLIANTRDIFDNAQPSGSSAAITAIYRMGHLAGNPDWTRLAVDAAKPLAEVASTHATAFGYLLQMMHQHCYPGNEIIIATESSTQTNPDPVTKQMLDIWREKFDPSTYLVVLPASENQQKNIFEHNSLSDSVFSSLYGDKTPRDGKTTAYICRDFRCRKPVQSPEAFRKEILSDNPAG